MYAEFLENLLLGTDSGVTAARAKLREFNQLDKEDRRKRFQIFVAQDESLQGAKAAIREMALGNEQCGMVASSKGRRLRRLGVFTPNREFNTVPWFTANKSSIESSSALEIAASEFKIQGLELDYVLMAWDGDFRYNLATKKFDYYRFVPKTSTWEKLDEELDEDVCKHIKNSYRVLLSRARLGMIVFVPKGDDTLGDESIKTAVYRDTYEYLHDRLGIKDIRESFGAEGPVSGGVGVVG